MFWKLWHLRVTINKYLLQNIKLFDIVSKVARYIRRYLSTRGRLLSDGHGSVAVKSPRRFKLVQQESETYD